MALHKLLAQITIASPNDRLALAYPLPSGALFASIDADTYDSILEVCANLEAKLQAGSAGFSVAVSSNGFVSISHSSGDFEIVAGSSDSDLLDLLGFTGSETTTGSGPYVMTATSRHHAAFYPPVCGQWPADRYTIKVREQETDDGGLVQYASSSEHRYRDLTFGLLSHKQLEAGGTDADGNGGTVNWSGVTYLEFWKYIREKSFRFYEDRSDGTVASPGAEITDYTVWRRMGDTWAPMQRDPGDYSYFDTTLALKYVGASSSATVAFSEGYGITACTATVTATGVSTATADGSAAGASTDTAVGIDLHNGAGISDGAATVEATGTTADYEMSKSIDVWPTHSINFGDNLDYDYDEPFSFAGWVRPKTFYEGYSTSLDQIFTKHDGTIGYKLEYDQDSGNVKLILANNGSNYIDVDFTDSTLALIDDWFHIAVTYDGSNLASGVTIYINGSSKSLTTNSDTLGTNTTTNSQSLVIGGLTARYCNFQNYSSELTSGNITSLYNGTAPTSVDPSNLEAWWKLGDGDSTGSNNILDSSNNSYTGTMSSSNDGLIVDDYPGADYSNSHAVRFDGTSYIDFGDQFDCNWDSELMASLWFKVTDVSVSSRMIFSKGNFGEQTDGVDGYFCYVNSNGTNDYIYFEFQLGFSGSSTKQRTARISAPEGTWSDGQWHHLALTYENDSDSAFTVTMFVDGQETTVTETNNDTFGES